ncbi:MAG TPA: ATP-grasp domain-containing protein [Acidimicrobiales bacterium]|nr:ATP-grasp domain-containing protein [Acidimicrobiales bacterium]
MGRRRRPPGTPTVVFVDDGKWNAFHQLAPGLRRGGVRTVRASTEGLRRTRVSSRLLFDRYAVLPHDPRPDALTEILAGENVVDIQFTESLAELVGECTDQLRPRVAEQLVRRLAMVDKVVASKLFTQAGVRTPAMIPVAEITAEEAVEKFGLPIVVKGSIGFGGEGVAIAHELDDLVEAIADDGDGPGCQFFEQFVVGEKLDYAAAVGPTGIEQELAYRIVRWNQPVGRATEVETIDDPQLVAFGRKVLEVVGCTGLANMDVIRDGQGLDWLIDFNPRAFGGSGCFRAAGIDTTEGYLRSIGEHSTPIGRMTPAVGIHIEVFPTCLEDVIESRSITRTAAAFMRKSFPYLRWMGWRYWLSEAFFTADTLRIVRKEAKARSAAAVAPSTTAATAIPEVPTR